MCEECEQLIYTKKKDKLEYIGTRIVSGKERYYYRCSECDHAFYWFDWCNDVHSHILPLERKASEIMILFQA